MNKHLIFLVYFCSAMLAGATGWRPDDRLLSAICQIESSGGLYVYGDGGLSLGHFQFQKAAWSDVSQWRQKRNLETHGYHPGVLDPQISRSYAADYLTIIYERLHKQYRRQPLPSELYAAYNMGLNKFRQCNYDLARINRITAGKCHQLSALLR